MLVLLAMLVIMLLLRLLSLKGMGWLLLAMADPLIVITAENHMLASAAATELMRQLQELFGCSICSSRT
jgi:hypothetical protein